MNKEVYFVSVYHNPLSRPSTKSVFDLVVKLWVSIKEKPHLTCVRRGFIVTPTGLKPVTF